MALYINGIVICEAFKDAEEIFIHFSNLSYMHNLDGSEPVKINGYWHLSLNPKGIGHGCPYDSESDREKYQNRPSEIINNIYSELIRHGDFELALVGEEILDRFYDKNEVDITDLGNIKIPNELMEEPSLVISTKIYKCLKGQNSFKKISQRSYWRNHELTTV